MSDESSLIHLFITLATHYSSLITHHLGLLHSPQLHLAEALLLALTHDLIDELILRIPVGSNYHRGVDFASTRDHFPIAIFRPQIGLDLAEVRQRLVFSNNLQLPLGVHVEIKHVGDVLLHWLSHLGDGKFDVLVDLIGHEIDRNDEEHEHLQDQIEQRNQVRLGFNVNAGIVTHKSLRVFSDE